MFFVLGSLVRVLKATAFKRFSVRPCWSPILPKFQNSIAGVFQCIFKKISEHVIYRTTINCYFATKKVRFKYCSSIVLFESEITSDQSSDFLLFVKFLLGIIFVGLCLKNAFDQESNENIAFVRKERKEIFFCRNQEVLCKNVSW